MEPVQTLGIDLVKAVLEGEVKRVVEKARAGKRLSDWEIGLLFINMLSLRINSLEKGYTEMRDEIKSLSEEIKSLRADMDGKISKVRDELREEIKSLKADMDGKIADVKDDTKYIKASLDQLRDNVISLLVGELRRSRREEPKEAGL